MAIGVRLDLNAFQIIHNTLVQEYGHTGYAYYWYAALVHTHKRFIHFSSRPKVAPTTIKHHHMEHVIKRVMHKNYEIKIKKIFFFVKFY